MNLLTSDHQTYSSPVVLIHPEDLFYTFQKGQYTFYILNNRIPGRIPKATPSAQSSTFLARFVRLIEECMEDPNLNVSMVSKALNVSSMQLYRRIKRITGQPPNQFIRRMRLQQGRSLLSSTDLSVSEIAYRIGFSDPNYFSRTFNQEFGIPPSDFRTNFLQSDTVPV